MHASMQQTTALKAPYFGNKDIERHLWEVLMDSFPRTPVTSRAEHGIKYYFIWKIFTLHGSTPIRACGAV